MSSTGFIWWRPWLLSAGFCGYAFACGAILRRARAKDLSFSLIHLGLLFAALLVDHYAKM